MTSQNLTKVEEVVLPLDLNGEFPDCFCGLRQYLPADLKASPLEQRQAQDQDATNRRTGRATRRDRPIGGTRETPIDVKLERTT